jgi:SP family facilitated glucose transporter-like MFS transporter 1
VISALRKLRGYYDVEDEIDEMKVEARKSQSVQSFTLKQLLTTVDLRWPIIIACVLQVSQQWSGINAVSYRNFLG